MKQLYTLYFDLLLLYDSSCFISDLLNLAYIKIQELLLLLIIRIMIPIFSNSNYHFSINSILFFYYY